MKNAEIREMTTAEINEQIAESKVMFTRMKLNHAVSPLDNPMKLKVARHEIARLKTELRRRQIEDISEDQNTNTHKTE